MYIEIMRKPLFILALMICSIGVYAQEPTMRDVFKQMSDSIVPYLSENNRLDFIDFMDSKMQAEVTNLLAGKSQMLELTDVFVSLELNQASSMQMRLLPVSEPVDSAKQIICVVRTFGTDIRESTVNFYSLGWRQLPTTDYLLTDDEMFVATLNSQSTSLTLMPVLRLDAPANEEQEELTKPSIILNWEGKYVNGY